jgi:hypothetical protein
MRGVSYDQPWLVIDTVNDPHTEENGLHYGEPARPPVIVPGRDGRWRYEFLLNAGEGRPGDIPSARLVADLLARYRRIEPHEIERAIIYTFHALVAERWQVERCFLLGDATHMVPPFAGQGLNSGIRDAGNLCWKSRPSSEQPLTPRGKDGQADARGRGPDAGGGRQQGRHVGGHEISSANSDRLRPCRVPHRLVPVDPASLGMSVKARQAQPAGAPGRRPDTIEARYNWAGEGSYDAWAGEYWCRGSASATTWATLAAPG